MSRPMSGLQRPKQPMPAFVKNALEARRLMDAYRDRPAYQQDEYLGWINRAKLGPTRQARLAQMLEELESGARYMNEAWQPAAKAQ